MNIYKRTINHNGSILLEALLSVVILSVSLTLIIQAMTSSLRASRYAADYTVAITILENKMFDLIQQGFDEASLGEEENITGPNGEYVYVFQANPLPEAGVAEAEDTAGGDVNEVDLKVSWTSGKKMNNIILNTYLFGPSDE